ncbi:gamma-glutamyl-gamma-aminobutyrate hydrolase family protein [Streptomyces sp. NPDC048419]|uniref:gamma-glutamyl-gamma-aminobutyrate hydrolase family protein n=1 Tax=Streptomyces sp. NPDC048419 TaxID=3365547 RepID=UPI003720E1C3
MGIPLIGITTYLSPARWGVWELPAAVLPAAYSHGIQAAGGLAVLLPPDAPAAAADLVSRLDGVVLAGGEDIDAALYGAVRHPSMDAPAPARDTWELAVLRAALELDLPLLGICRGMQLMNVHAGGTLIQHLPEHVGHEGHNLQPGIFTPHVVTTMPHTRIGRVYPDATSVPTHHHQAIDRLGDGLTVTARAEDDTVEAVEFAGQTFRLGVQWHPEMSPDQAVLDALVAAARAPASTAPGEAECECTAATLREVWARQHVVPDAWKRHRQPSY